MGKYIDADMLEKDGWNIQRIRQVSSIEMIYETKKPTDFPTADVVEVVRCKDCKHSEEFIYPEGLEIMVCWEDNADREVNRNGFCEKGERKDG